MGGLGNQLFQYAAARSLAMFLDDSFQMDLQVFTNTQNDPFKQKYSLKHFNIKENIAPPSKIPIFHHVLKLRYFNKIRYRYFSNSINLWLSKLLDIPHLLSDPNYVFNDNFFKRSKDIYLDGYWQSPKYFKNIRALLLKEITLKEKMSKRNESLLEEIRDKESVSIHLMRNYYINLPKKILKSIKTYPLPLHYYTNSIAFINKRTNHAHFYIFSDNIEWAKENLKVDENVIFVDHNRTRSHVDFFLMSQCKHNIIANSTFSWWAAWINPYGDKLIIAPQWFKKKFKINTSDLLPLEWNII